MGEEIPPDVHERVRARCIWLPESYEESAWTGIRWCVRKKTFAHVVHVEDGWPPAYARAMGSDGPADVLTFRSAGPELAALTDIGRPYFRPPWFPDIVGMFLDVSTDWDEVADLVTESYCLLAPKKLVKQIRLPEVGSE